MRVVVIVFRRVGHHLLQGLIISGQSLYYTKTGDWSPF